MADALPTVLVVNDDSHGAPGIRALAAALHRSKRYRVVVVAPLTEQSGVSHSITIFRPLRARRSDFAPWDASEDDARERIEAYTVDGTPADCVKIAPTLIGGRVDVVASGINRGPNTGLSVHASGTLGAAREAAVQGIPAVGFSLDMHHGAKMEPPSMYARAAEMAAGIVDRVVRGAADLRAHSAFVNVNFPAAVADTSGVTDPTAVAGSGAEGPDDAGPAGAGNPFAGYKFTRMGLGGYEDRYVFRGGDAGAAVGGDDAACREALVAAMATDDGAAFDLRGHLKPADAADTEDDTVAMVGGYVSVSFLPAVVRLGGESDVDTFLSASPAWTDLWGG